MAEFDWSKDSDAVVLPHQPQTAVYRNGLGQVVVRQEKSEWEEYDPSILLTPQGALAVAWAMIEEAHLVGLPQPSSSLMPVDESGQPQKLDPALAAMCAKRAVPKPA